MFDKKAPMKQQRLGDSVKGKDVEVIGRQGQKLAKGGRVKKRKNTRRMNRLEELGRVDANLFSNPYATEFTSTGVGSFPTVQGVTNINGSTKYYEHEKGVDQVDTD